MIGITILLRNNHIKGTKRAFSKASRKQGVSFRTGHTLTSVGKRGRWII